MAISLSKRGMRLRRISTVLFVAIGLYFVATVVLAGMSISTPAWISGVVYVGLGTGSLVARWRARAETDLARAED